MAAVAEVVEVVVAEEEVVEEEVVVVEVEVVVAEVVEAEVVEVVEVVVEVEASANKVLAPSACVRFLTLRFPGL